MDQNEGQGSVLQPGQSIRPKITEDQAKDLVLNLYGMRVTSIKELNSYIDKNFWVKVSEDHSNPNVDGILPFGYVLKVLNSMDSQQTHVDAEHEAEQHCHVAGVCCPLPVPDLKGRDYSKQVLHRETNNNDQTAQASKDVKHIVRLLTFIPGKIFVNVPYKPNLLYDCGRFVACMRNVIEGFSHPAISSHSSIRNMASVPKLHAYLYAVTDEKRKGLVREVLNEFADTVIPRLKDCSKGVIHGDLNEQNIIVRPTEETKLLPEPDREYQVAGVIDFGHLCESYYIFDLAINVMYLMVESKVVDSLSAGGYVLAGYLSHCSLNDTEWDILKTCVAGRYCQSLVMGAYTYSMDPGNEYALVTVANGWPQLERLWATPKEQLYDWWKEIIPSVQNEWIL